MKIVVAAFCALVVFSLGLQLPWQPLFIITVLYAMGEWLWQMYAWSHGFPVRACLIECLVRTLLLAAMWLGQLVFWLGWVK